MKKKPKKDTALCDCYRERESVHYLTEKEKAVRYILDTMFNRNPNYSKSCETVLVGHCYGQKNTPECSCKGDRSKCDAGYFKNK